MKIDFDAPFAHISRLIEPRVGAHIPSAQGENFERTLASERNPGGSPESEFAFSVFSTRTMMRPLSGPSPFDLAPHLDPTPGLIKPALPERVESPPAPVLPSVKSPTVLGVRRVQVGDDFAALSSEERIVRVQHLVQSAGEKYGVDPALSMAVVSAESSFNPSAVSSDGHASKGLMQLLDTTGQDLAARTSMNQPYDPFKPELNIDLGVQYLRHLHEIFSKATLLPNELTTKAAANSTSLEKLAVAAFNAGEGRVASAQQRAEKAGKNPAEFAQVEPYLPDSTREYVNRVLSRRQDFASRFVG